ncbi:MAG: metallophosphoesterase, partial [Duncaniella sp.]|nr:metallophosphoesterase [Duncaniella sp.]
MSEILIIPDVHGRRFWREAVDRYPDADTIFLGDYHDPYPQERISVVDSLENFRELVDHARSHPNCHLLMGNHDLHYLCDFGEACRQDFENSASIIRLLRDNLDLFSIATLRKLEGKTVVFSHAPILQEWIETVGETDNVELLVSRLNRLLTTIVDKPWETEDLLGYISGYRGGYE